LSVGVAVAFAAFVVITCCHVWTGPGGICSGCVGVNTYDYGYSAGTATATFWKPVRDRQDSAAGNYASKNWEGVASFNDARDGLKNR
jgi:hypothetical protein